MRVVFIDMKLKPITKRRIYHYILEQIQQSIKEDQIRPGERLPSERYLADSLSVSRTSVKEAISVLDSSGVVTIKPGVGIFLKDDGVDNIVYKINTILTKSLNVVEILEFRQAVEGDAAYYAALRSTRKDLKALNEAFFALEQAVSKRVIAAKEDYAFHMAICKASENVMLQKVILLISDTLLDSLNESRSQTLTIPGRSEAVLEEHRRINDAIHKGDAVVARQEMWAHLQNVKIRFI